jgi:hypothetical protein
MTSFLHKFTEWDGKTRWEHDKRRCLNCGVSIHLARAVNCDEVQKLSLVVEKIYDMLQKDVDKRVLDFWK